MCIKQSEAIKADSQVLHLHPFETSLRNLAHHVILATGRTRLRQPGRDTALALPPFPAAAVILSWALHSRLLRTRYISRSALSRCARSSCVQSISMPEVAVRDPSELQRTATAAVVMVHSASTTSIDGSKTLSLCLLTRSWERF